jgi:hypothetical protein
MAKPTSQQQSSQLKKLLFVGGGLVLIVLVAFPSGSSTTTEVKKVNPLAGTSTTKKTKESLYTEEDKLAKFESIPATIKNGFVPLVRKGDGVAEPTGGIPRDFTGGEGTWTYTGNMVVDGTPNALLENSASGDGVFLRPGQRWKNLRLIAVKEDSIELEGPSGARKTVFFNDKSISMAAPSTTLQALPPATIQGNLPNGANPMLNQPGGNPRRQRDQFGNQANMEAMVGPIGSSDNLESSIDYQQFANNSNNSGKNRKIKRNQ